MRGSGWVHLAHPIRALICGLTLLVLPPVGYPASAFAQSKSVASERSLMDAEKAMLRSLSAQSVEKATVQGRAKSQGKEKSLAKGQNAPQGAVRPAAQVQKASAQTAESPSPREESKLKPKSSAPTGEAVAVKSDIPEVAPSSQSKELQAALARIALLEQQLDEARSQLAISETEVNRLSGIVDSKARAGMDKYKLPVPANRVPVNQPRRVIGEQPPVRPPASDNSPAKVDDPLHVATVTVEKAELRLGPGKNHSALMTVRQGSRLMIEARQGEWYRVFAPNGERAWIQASLVSFGDGAASLNDGSSVRVKGFSVGAEEEAFRKLQRITAGQ
jgi:hypothetical protein